MQSVSYIRITKQKAVVINMFIKIFVTSEIQKDSNSNYLTSYSNSFKKVIIAIIVNYFYSFVILTSII